MSEGDLSDQIKENLGNLRVGNNINEDFLSSISFKNFMDNCGALLGNQVSLNVELNDKMNNLDTEIIDVNEVMSISDDYSSISRVKVPLKEIDDSNRFVGCVSCRSKVQITDMNKID